MANDAEQLEQLTAYLDGELSPAQCAEVDRLLSNDPGARALLDELRQTSRLVSALPREPAPDGLADAVVNRMERRDLLGDSPPHHATSSGVVSWSRRFAVAASIALVGTAVWIAWPHFTQLMTAEKQPIRLAQADKVEETLTPPTLEERDQSEIGKAKTLRPSARPAIGNALAENAVRAKTPLALGYAGDDADEEEPGAEAEDEAVPAFSRRFVAKLESRAAEQPAARAATAPEPAQSVTVETDVATIARLTDLIEKDMARHAVPMLQADAQERVARSDEAFFTLRRAAAASSPAPSSAGARSRVAISGDEVRIVMRVPQDVAGQVLADMYRISEEAGTAAGWTTVGRPFVPSRVGGRVSNRTEGKDSPAVAKEDVQKAAPPASDRLEKKRAIAPAEQDAAGSKDGGLFDDEHLPAQKKDRTRSVSAHPASQPAPPPDEPLVTLTILLRTKPATSPSATTQPSTQPAGLPTSQAAPRSTTQEAPGG